MLHNPKARITARLTILLYLATLAALLVSTFYPRRSRAYPSR